MMGRLRVYIYNYDGRPSHEMRKSTALLDRLAEIFGL
jgi:hypothetical protein